MPRLSPALVRRIVAWLLAVLVPLQATAAGMLAATGPLHTHTLASTRLVLEDLRRAPAARSPRETHMLTAFGHFHGASTPERHHHARGDAGVAIDASASLLAGDADDAGATALSPLLIGLIAPPSTWRGTDVGQAPAVHIAWSAQTHHPAFPDRPPRAA